MKRGIAIAVLVVALTLGGCAHTDSVRVPDVVQTPVDASPVVEMPNCPALIEAPKAGASAAEIVKAAQARIAEQRACIERLKKLLAPYTAKQPVAEPAP